MGKKIYLVRALDCASYKEGEFVDLIITGDFDRDNENILKEWAREQERPFSCFMLREIDESILKDLKEEMIDQVHSYASKLNTITKKESELL